MVLKAFMPWFGGAPSARQFGRQNFWQAQLAKRRKE